MKKIIKTSLSDLRHAAFAVAVTCMIPALFFSCAKEDLDYGQLNLIGEPRPIMVNAILPTSASIDKTTVGADGKVRWKSTDSICVNNSFLQIKEIISDTLAVFAGEAGAIPVQGGNGYWATFPASLNADNYTRTSVSVNLPAVQGLHDGNSLPNYMAAYTAAADGENLPLNFKNLCCILKLPVMASSQTGEKAQLSKIEVSSDCKLSGTATVQMDANGNPVLSFPDGKTTVRLDCDNTVLNQSTPDTFRILIPAGTQSLTVKFYDATNRFVEKKLSNREFKRSYIYTMGDVSLNATEKDSYLNAEYSVSSTLKVTFASGNLQWSPYGGTTSTTTHAVAGGGTGDGTFRIAENQYDYVGGTTDDYPGNVYHVDASGTLVKSSNKSPSDTYRGWIDLFRFGASGYNSCHPYLFSGSSTRVEQTIAQTNYDWGVYNAIRCGSDEGTPGEWRVLTKSEWDYLMNMDNKTTTGRQGSRFAMARVHDVCGFLIYPDQYDTLPASERILSGQGIFDVNKHGKAAGGYPSQSIPDATWEKMERNGVLFLPMTGGKNTSAGQQSSSSTYTPYCFYWASTISSGDNVDAIHICRYHTELNDYDIDDDLGFAVRLVKNIK